MAEQQVSLPQAKNAETMIPAGDAFAANWLRDQQKILALRRYKMANDWQVPMSLIMDSEPKPAVDVNQKIEGSSVRDVLPAICILVGAILGAGLLAFIFLLTRPDATPAPPAPQQPPGKIEPDSTKIKIRWKLGDDGEWRVSADDGKTWQKAE